MPLTKVSLSIDNETIVCEYALRKQNAIILHGAGLANRKRYYSFAEYLLQKDIGVVLFDFSGHGESSGELAQLSLERRKKQALTVIDTLVPRGPLFLIGFSMSGQTVIDLLPELRARIHGVLLGCPAIYSQRAQTVFGDIAFTTEIRTRDSWKNSSAFSILPTYTENAIIAIGEQDEVIPPVVIQNLHELLPQSTLVRYPEVSHQLAAWLGEHPKELSSLLDQLIT